MQIRPFLFFTFMLMFVHFHGDNSKKYKRDYFIGFHAVINGFYNFILVYKTIFWLQQMWEKVGFVFAVF